MNYAKLSLPEISAEIRAVADDAHATFGAVENARLNWKADEKQWSAAQCFDHLVRSNELLVDAAKAALTGPPTSIWQRLPLWPAMFGALLIGSQGPRGPRSAKFTTTPKQVPPSDVPPGIIQRFVDQHHELERWSRSLDEGTADRAILLSPFARVVSYSVLDALRLLVAHDRRHFEQARRVLAAQPSATNR